MIKHSPYKQYIWLVWLLKWNTKQNSFNLDRSLQTFYVASLNSTTKLPQLTLCIDRRRGGYFRRRCAAALVDCHHLLLSQPQSYARRHFQLVQLKVLNIISLTMSMLPIRRRLLRRMKGRTLEPRTAPKPNGRKSRRVFFRPLSATLYGLPPKICLSFDWLIDLFYSPRDCIICIFTFVCEFGVSKHINVYVAMVIIFMRTENMLI